MYISLIIIITINRRRVVVPDNTWCQKYLDLTQMASFTLRPLTTFNFRQPEEWKKWLARFEQFRIASGLSTESGERQVSSLLYCMGDDAGDVLATTNISDGDKKDYGKVVKKFNDYLKVRKNTVFERANFNLARQLADETAEHFIIRLHQMADNCEFGAIRSEMIRDRLVIGIRDEQLSERLQTEPELTLTKAERFIRQRAAVTQQQQLLKSPADSQLQLASMSKQPRVTNANKKPPTQQSSRNVSSQRAKVHKCRRCGKDLHPIQQCPARDSQCRKCNRKGHFTSKCLSKTVAEVTMQMDNLTTTGESSHPDEPFDSDFVFLNTIEGNGNSKDIGTSWNVVITIENTQISFKVDTGAEVTAMSESAWLNLQNTFQLGKTKQKIYGPDHLPLDVVGVADLPMSFKGNTCTQPVFIIRNLRNNLLGLPAIKLLQILPRQLDTIGQSIPDQFPNFFNGLGNMKGHYSIKLKPGAKPFALYTPRSIPLPLRDKVQTELTRMEQMGVISKVQTPTPWCAAMVVVPKANGGVRICVDLKPLNQSVLREVHPLPKVETTLAQLSGATVFSKIDTNSGFWQIPLDPASRLLTTFLTPFGRFCYNKLPFGITSAPEHFQRRMNNILEGLPGVVCHIDDILIFGKDQQEHDE